MTDELALELARDACFNSIEKHSYTPKNEEQAMAFEPHLWVLDAIKMAYEHGLDDGAKE